MTRRRFARHVHEQQQPIEEFSAEGKSRKFAYPPNLYVVDGGAPQVNAAQAVLDDLGVADVASSVWPSGSRRCGYPRNLTR